MLYLTDIPFGDDYLAISYEYEDVSTSHPYGDGSAIEEMVDFFIEEITLNDKVVDIEDPYLWAYIEEMVIDRHADVVRMEDEARYGI